MDEYLYCLYEYIQEHISPREQPNAVEYYRCADAATRAWTALTEALTPAQLQLVEDYRSAQDRVSVFEDQFLFQKAVSLGKWLSH